MTGAAFLSGARSTSPARLARARRSQRPELVEDLVEAELEAHRLAGEQRDRRRALRRAAARLEHELARTELEIAVDEIMAARALERPRVVEVPMQTTTPASSPVRAVDEYFAPAVGFDPYAAARAWGRR